MGENVWCRQCAKIQSASNAACEKCGAAMRPIAVHKEQSVKLPLILVWLAISAMFLVGATTNIFKTSASDNAAGSENRDPAALNTETLTVATLNRETLTVACPALLLKIEAGGKTGYFTLGDLYAARRLCATLQKDQEQKTDSLAISDLKRLDSFYLALSDLRHRCKMLPDKAIGTYTARDVAALQSCSVVQD
jgi:hypothetical protein